MKKIWILVGTRPNFIKVTQFKKIAQRNNLLSIEIIHTGQHYDEKMADVFFRQFDLIPDHFLNIGAGSPNGQIAETIIRLEQLGKNAGLPELLIVPGDVNSTLAGAIFANKAGVKLAHLEAGLRSFDREMPEEFNRIVADQLSDLHFITEPSGLLHLRQEGRSDSHLYFVGNTMIDTMVAFEKEIDASNVLSELGIHQKFVLMTMHRPSNVDHKEGLIRLLDLIRTLVARYQVVFPIHPRTEKMAQQFGLWDQFKKTGNLIRTGPLDYFSFQKLVKQCEVIITDSGGVQEESTFRQKPCITLRENTERPVTVDVGTNTLAEFDILEVAKLMSQISAGTYKKGKIPDLWDGYATERILEILEDQFR